MQGPHVAPACGLITLPSPCNPPKPWPSLQCHFCLSSTASAAATTALEANAGATAAASLPCCTLMPCCYATGCLLLWLPAGAAAASKGLQSISKARSLGISLSKHQHHVCKICMHQTINANLPQSALSSLSAPSKWDPCGQTSQEPGRDALPSLSPRCLVTLNQPPTHPPSSPL